MTDGITRRMVLRGAGAAGVVGALATRAPTSAWAQAGAQAPALGGQESVQSALKRLFGARPLKDGAGVIKLEAPPIAENGALVQVSVEAASPMTAANHVKTIYLVADKNRIPVVTRATLTPEMGQAFVGETIRLGETTDVRAIVEQSDGTLLQVRREVKVTVGGCGG
ncbi:MAG: thiosulfate oxidation carrier protein SoxY [Candidatus Rokubacteria bacterium]|nr:thiosulfate oxidation carrier protein SoxY [Candidatus Rokubacteria bacterium]MBI3826671.1 thiosulfate oxidation carrier protein SoxY [Candidatus Rokubacteria bacterium]